MFNFASALLIGSAAAFNQGQFFAGRHQQQQSHQAYPRHQASYQPSHQDNVPAKYNSFGNGGHQESRYPSYHQQQPSYHQQSAPHYQHAGSAEEDHHHAQAWDPKPAPVEEEAEPEIDTEGWYNPAKFQQYSPVYNKYTSNATHPTFARCDLDIAEGVAVEVQLMQLPDYPIFLRASGLANSDMGRFDDIDIQINRLGCNAMDEEFNNLTETNKWGMVNPFQDPSRGTINGCAVVDDDMEIGQVATVADDYFCNQKDLMQNLSGKDGLLGRSLTFSSASCMDSTDENGVLETICIANDDDTCCIIAIDETPDHYQPKPAPRHW